jgi:hypothetical protein
MDVQWTALAIITLIYLMGLAFLLRKWIVLDRRAKVPIDKILLTISIVGGIVLVWLLATKILTE